MMSSQTLLLTSLTAYFQRHPDHRNLLFDLVTGRSPLSLRVIDWFLTHYAKSHQVIYWLDDHARRMHEEFPADGGPHLRKFHMYYEYRAQLKSYTKMYFDSFRRHERITFVLEQEPLRTIDTTVGQLNLFRWALQNQVITFIQHHLTEIEEHMAQHQKKARAAANANAPGSKTVTAAAHVKAAPAERVKPTTRPTSSHVIQGPTFIRFD